MQELFTGAARAEFVDVGSGKRAYYAEPSGAGPFPAVLVFQEAFGIDDYMQSEVRRLAERGYAAIAPDLFGGQTFGYNDRESIFGRLKALTDEGMLDDAGRCVAYLDAQPNVRTARYGAVGFCMGGRLAVLTAAALREKIAAASSLYGGGVAPREQRVFPPLLDRLPGVTAELLLIYGAEDASIEPDEHGRIAELLSREKKRYTLSVYPNAGHGFASRDRESYLATVAEAAWRETLALFERTLS